jgi:holo-[acyl-carrier protein] synthase
VRVATGIDAVDVERFAASLARRPRITERLFTEAERLQAANSPLRLAGRFAVKEAAMKALGVGLGSVRLCELEVWRQETGAPVLRLVGEAERRARELGWLEWSVSLSHTAKVAVAVVVALLG